MKLFHVQDPDSPMWVVADSYGEAVDRWFKAVGIDCACERDEIDEPQGVTLVCQDFELLLPNQDIPGA